jgi:hypothetical protein
MIKMMTVLFFIWAGYTVGWSGRFRIEIKHGSRTERILERIHLVGIAVVAAIAFVLPSLTGFQGFPALGYFGGALLTTSLILFRYKVSSFIGAVFPATGTRSKSLQDQHLSRWPYCWTYALGYLTVAAYIFTIFPLYW